MAVEYPGELTAALAVEEEVVDGFGTGVVQGFISVTGVSDSLLNATSQEAAIQEVRYRRYAVGVSLLVRLNSAFYLCSSDCVIAWRDWNPYPRVTVSDNSTIAGIVAWNMPRARP